MSTLPILNEAQAIAEIFESSISILNETKAVKDTRSKAYRLFNQIGLPLKSNEEYKYSGTEKLFKDGVKWYAPESEFHQINFQEIRKQNTEVAHIFLINGVLVPEESEIISNDNGVIVSDIQSAAANHPQLFDSYYGKNSASFNDAVAQLNTAFSLNGLFLWVAENKTLPKPIQINHIGDKLSNHFVQTHHVIIAEKHASFNIIENFISLNDNARYYNSRLAEITVKENAQVNFYQLQNENNQVVHFNNIQVLQHSNSVFDTNTVTLGAAWVRNNLNIVLNGLHCESHLNGLQLLNAAQHVDNHTLVDHQMPNCESNQLYKGILKGKSTGVFNGKIFVRKDAQKTNAYQSSKNMLLSDEATMNTKPQLEIYADDVKCSHGSSTGQIDQNAVFYLKARGLSQQTATALLMNAFAFDVIDKLKVASYKKYVQHLIEMHLK